MAPLTASTTSWRQWLQMSGTSQKRKNDNAEEVFDPKVHLAYTPPTTKLTFEDLRLPRSPTSTEVAATVPFPLLSPRGIRAYRRALFASEVVEKCSASPFPGTLTLRNASAHSRFIRDFWNHPETLRAVSDAAGVPLSIVMPTEIAHTNIQASGTNVANMMEALEVEPSNEKIPLTDEERAYDPLKASSIIPWHYDSYPYVCVVMLSDTDGMVGGQTFIERGDGMAQEVKGPSLGYGVILQGGEVKHLAARALGVKERISTITSFTADVPGVYDSSYITNLRCYTEPNVLYKQWTQFRLQKMQTEICMMQAQISKADGPLDVEKVHRFVECQTEYLKRTAHQLIQREQVDESLAKYGRRNIHEASNIFHKATALDDFTQLAMMVTREKWLPHSSLWADLAESRLKIGAKKYLPSQQTGQLRWKGTREYTMGDELSRQGLPELLLSWMDAAGLYDKVSQDRQ
ncbi:uncharacterized protein HMPREF1541_10146 [Cyphellophora europaea CBS 101466]|uniref:Fe2OG dioxygenase domain-containing protein n=1 Tax=Cyphellophora europaea (strain CBS 101466) TaxID=1220924 RepID=W2S6Z4_CYPE1|nr:uncharacterized protein HMPREF1541_10146 [Cyphellophora europaea CBS 101466]ETN44476.1 hypothetical protein HMPREF1541_10146 [Cyphellophora europaea CBS 101466]